MLLAAIGKALSPKRPTVRPTRSDAKWRDRSSDRRTPPRAPLGLEKLGFRLGVGLAVLLLVGTVGLIGLSQGLPDPRLLEVMNGGGGVVYRYRDARTELAIHGRRPGPPVDIDRLPPYVGKAFIAIEDERFYSNGGVDVRATVRAIVTNMKTGKFSQGGSTITQQLVRRMLLKTNDKSITRKAQEMILAVRVARRYPKNQVLQMYLTSLDYNREAVGLNDAARIYFAKSPNDLTLSEAAMLAAMINGPSRYDPLRRYEQAWTRSQLVLKKMLQLGMLGEGAAGQAAYEDALAHPPVLPPAGSRSWRFAVRKVRYQNDSTGLYLPQLADRLKTTLYVNMSLDENAQGLAEQIVRSKLAPHPRLEAVFIAADGRGAVRALIGSRRFVNTDGYSGERQQLGSVYKLFIYAAAMEAGANPDSLCDDLPGLSWAITNHDGGFHGRESLNAAFAYSSNVVATRLSGEVGYERVTGFARDLGLTGAPPPRVLSWPLSAEASPLALAQSMLPFANGGRPVKLHFTDDIITLEGRRVVELLAPAERPVISQSTLAAMHRLARSAVIAPGATGGRAPVAGRWIGGKTGTTNDNRDTWFAAYGRDWVAVAWVGRPDNRPLPSNLSGGTLAAEIVGEFVRRQSLGWGDPPSEADPPSAKTGSLFSGPAAPAPGEGCDAGAEPATF